MVMGSRFVNLFHELKPVFVMILVQSSFAAVNVFYKLALNDGMNMRVLVAYRFIFAVGSLAPTAFFVERKARPKLTWKVLFLAFLCGLFGGSLAQNLYVSSLHLTSAMFASAIANLIPSCTFIMAVACGFEKLSIRRRSGQAKFIGTLTGLGGAMLLTFYKGVEIKTWSTRVLHIHPPYDGHHNSGEFIFGALLAFGSCLSYATWLIVQTKMSQVYRCPMSSTTLMCIMASMQSVIFAFCMDQDTSLWKLGWNIRLLSVSFTGILGSGLTVALISWCILVRGPLFVSVFNPLMLVLVAIAGALMLDEMLHLGTILGSVMIVLGLYVVLWGKAREMKTLVLVRSRKTAPLDDSSPSSNDTIEIVITPPSLDKDSYQNVDTGSLTTSTIEKVDQCSPDITSVRNSEETLEFKFETEYRGFERREDVLSLDTPETEIRDAK